MKIDKCSAGFSVLALVFLFFFTSCPGGDIKLPEINLEEILNGPKDRNSGEESGGTNKPSGNSGSQTSGSPTGEGSPSPETPNEGPTTGGGTPTSEGMGENTPMDAGGEANNGTSSNVEEPAEEPAAEAPAVEAPAVEAPVAEACGGGCPPMQNATTSCVNNRCEWTCNNGYVNCNFSSENGISDGCEANVNSDPNNCGACAAVCPSQAPNTTRIECRQGQCIVAACDAGFYNCNGWLSDGCESRRVCP